MWSFICVLFHASLSWAPRIPKAIYVDYNSRTCAVMLYVTRICTRVYPQTKMVNYTCFNCTRLKHSSQMHSKAENYQGICKTCHNQGINMLNYKSSSSSSSSSQQQQQQLEFLSHHDTDTQRMNSRQRDAIITLHQNGDSINEICMKVGCVKSTVYRWK